MAFIKMTINNNVRYVNEDNRKKIEKLSSNGAVTEVDADGYLVTYSEDEVKSIIGGGSKLGVEDILGIPRRPIPPKRPSTITKTTTTAE